MGYIYKIISPSGKIYIGQTIKNINKRWKEHIEDAFNPKKDHCKALNNAIRKYDINDFIIEIVIECDNNLLDDFEMKYMIEYNSNVPNGYNIKLGGSNGKHSEDTKSKISESSKGRVISEHTRNKIMLSRKSNKELPMYILEVKEPGGDNIIGYRVYNHPNYKEKRFLSKYQTLEEKLQRAKDYIG